MVSKTLRSAVLAGAECVEVTKGRKAQIRTAWTVSQRTRGIAKLSSQAILWCPCRGLVVFMVIVPDEDWANGIAKLETAASIERMRRMSKRSISDYTRDCQHTISQRSVLHHSDKAFFAICMNSLLGSNPFTDERFTVLLNSGNDHGPKLIDVVRSSNIQGALTHI